MHASKITQGMCPIFWHKLTGRFPGPMFRITLEAYNFELYITKFQDGSDYIYSITLALFYNSSVVIPQANFCL